MDSMVIDGVAYEPLEPWQEVLNLRVDNGEGWLDENVPDWVSRINPKHLTLASATFCVTGQVFNTMWQKNQGRAENLTTGWDYWCVTFRLVGEMYGFDLPYLYVDGCDGDCPHKANGIDANSGWSYLTEEWLRRIQKRVANQQ